MKKRFTLILASMLLTMGAWAQKTPVLTYTNVTAPTELLAADAATIREMPGMTFVADVKVTSSSVAQLLFAAVADYTSSNTDNNSIWGLGLGGSSLRYIVGPRDGGWYSSANGSLTTAVKKIIFTYDGTTIKYYVDGTNVKSQASTKALNTFTGENAKFYLGGVIYNKNTEWGKFSGTLSKVEIYNSVFTDAEIMEMCYPEEVVITPEEFENGKIYTFQTSLGWMGARNEDNNAISTARTSVADYETSDYFRWSVYKSEKGNYYIYNVGKGMFLGEQSTTGNASVPMSETPAMVTFKATTKGGYPLMFKTTDNASCVVNHSTNHGTGLITWNGGWSNTNDNGNSHLITAIGELNNEMLTTIKNAVDAYEADNTEAVAALGEAISTVEAWVASNVGVGVGKYTYNGDGTFEAKIQEYKDYCNGITEKNNPAPAEVEAKTAEVNALIDSFQLNMPEAGKFYTFKNDDYYITSSTIATGNRNIALSTTKDATAIYYYDGSHLLAYTTGLYIGLDGTDWGFEAIGSNNVSVIEFIAAANGAVAKYNIKSGGRWLHRTDAYVNRCSSNTCGNAHNWTIEEVTELPATIGTVGYATLNAPVALTIPAGVKAYTGALNGEWLTLNEVSTTIPANTAVILEATETLAEATTFNFTVAAGVVDAINENALSGTIEAVAKADTHYTLQSNGEGGVVFKKYTGTNLSGFKAYLDLPTEAAAIGIRFEDGTTAIDNVQLSTDNVVIYDLSGRRVEKMEKGIYIVNGKKVIR